MPSKGLWVSCPYKGQLHPLQKGKVKPLPRSQQQPLKKGRPQPLKKGRPQPLERGRKLQKMKALGFPLGKPMPGSLKGPTQQAALRQERARGES